MITRGVREYFLKLSLNQKLIAMMLLLSLSLMTVYFVLYFETEQAMYREFENQTAELSKAIQVGVEEVTSAGATDEKRLQGYMKKLNTRGVKEISIISNNSDKIISSSDPGKIGKGLSTKRRELIFKAELGEPVTDEGLAYNAGSAFERPVLFPGTFRAWFQTKHATGAFGTRLIVDEIKRIRTEKCDVESVENSKASFISDLVNPFSNKNSIVNTFADDQYTGRPDDYWRNYKKNMEAVTPDDVLAVAQKYLHPDKLVFLVVGDPEAVEKGSDKHSERFSDFGPITVLPLRDPMTLEMK